MREGGQKTEFRGSDGKIYHLAALGNEELLTAEHSGLINHWVKSATGWERQHTFRPLEKIFGFTVHPDGKSLACCDGEKIWIGTIAGAATWEEVRPCQALRFSPDGALLAGAGEANGLFFLDLKNKEVVARWQGHSNVIAPHGLAFHPDGSFLVSGSYDQTVRLWRHPDFELALPGLDFQAPGIIGTAVTASEHGRVFVAANDGAVSEWDLSRRTKGEHERTFQDGAVGDLASSPGGEELAVAGENSVEVWNVPRGDEWTTVARIPFDGRCNSVAWAAENGRLFAAGESGEVSRWQVSSRLREVTANFGAPAYGLAVSADQKFVAFATSAGEVNIVDPQTLERQQVLRARPLPDDGDRRGVHCVFQPGTANVAYLTLSGIALWDCAQKREVWSVRNLPAGRLAFSVDGSRLVFCGWNTRSARIIDAAYGREILQIPLLDSTLYAAATVGDSGYIVCTGREAKLQILDARPIVLPFHLPSEHASLIRRMSFLGDNLLQSEDEKESIVWDVETKSVVKRNTDAKLDGHFQRRFSSDGKWFAVPEANQISIYPRPQLADFADRAVVNAPSPEWHRRQASIQDRAGNPFAANFHRQVLARLQPESKP